MLRTGSFRFRNIVYVLTGLCVLSFQAWWLRDGYDLRRKALLDRVTTETKQYLSLLILQQLAPSLSVSGPDTAEIDLSGLLGKRRYSKADTQKLEAAERELQKGPSSISFNIRTPVEREAVAKDSQLYLVLREAIPELHDSDDLVVYQKTEKATHSFPEGMTAPAGNSTEWIDSDTRLFGSFRIGVRGLFWKLLPGMLPAILFSLLYLCLFVWTILALLRTIRENMRLLESKADFTQNMTHELKIPISGLFLATEALERFNDIDDPAKARRHIATIRKGLQQLSMLVDRILNSARLQGRQVRLQRSVVLLRPLLERICTEMSPLIEERSAKVRIEELPEEAAVYADPEQLQHVFYNLIDNAVKYAPGAAEVCIRAFAEGADNIVEIRDNGIGIAPAHQERVFEAYFRVPQQDRHDVKGYGLGLSIVKQILLLHEGDIRITQSGPAGTTFQIRLPRHDA